MAEYLTDVLIIGSGPAGCTAGIYAARSGLNPIIVSGEQAGGQLMSTNIIENFPGFEVPLSGPELMEKMKNQALNVGVRFVNDTIKEVDFSSRPFVCNSNLNSFSAKSVIIATGASTKWLGVEKEKDLIGRGVATCATCDGYFYRGKDVAVIGGGNTAVKEALFLAQLVNSVTVIHRRDKLRADKIEQDKAFRHNKIKFEWDSVVEELITEENPLRLTEIKLRNLKTDIIKNLKVDGVFIAVGYSPNTEIFKRYINLDEKGYIITEKGCCKTNIAGIYAAGDVKNPLYHQAIISAGSGALAALEAENFINS